MTGKVPELVKGEMSLLLDSGTWMNTSVSSRTVEHFSLGKKVPPTRSVGTPAPGSDLALYFRLNQ